MTDRMAAGWDGGGTKTRVCLTDENGTEIALRDFGPLNINGASEKVVKGTVREAVQWMGTFRAACASLVIGMAGVSNRSAAGFVEKAVRESGYQGPMRMLGDQEIALAGAVSGHGAVLIAGTGSVLNGRDLGGKPFRVGGYGYLIDDPGSGYAIGRDILKAVVRAGDGRGPQTCLTRMVFETLKTADIGGVITWLYAPETGKREIASIARLLPEALAFQDEAAVGIQCRAAEELSALVLAGWRKTGMQDGELALTGSILEHMDGIRAGLEKQVHAVFPEIRIGAPKADAAHGAAQLALAGMREN